MIVRLFLVELIMALGACSANLGYPWGMLLDHIGDRAAFMIATVLGTTGGLLLYSADYLRPFYSEYWWLLGIYWAGVCKYFHYNDVIMGAMASQITSQPHDCVLKRLFRRRSKETSKLRVTSLCAGNSPDKMSVTRKMFPFDDVIMFSTIYVVEGMGVGGAGVSDGWGCIGGDVRSFTFYFSFFRPAHFLGFRISRHIAQSIDVKFGGWTQHATPQSWLIFGRALLHSAVGRAVSRYSQSNLWSNWGQIWWVNLLWDPQAWWALLGLINFRQHCWITAMIWPHSD